MAIINSKSQPPFDFSKASRKEIVEFLYSKAFKFFKSQGSYCDFITFKEVHLTPQLRCDILNLAANDTVTIVELKTCRADFVADSKWEKYLDYCDYFYFMCPPGVIKKEEISNKVGLIYTTNSLFEIKQYPFKLKPRFINHTWLSYIYKKLCFRKFAKVNNNLISLDEEILFTNQ
jgi:hypothetical protein